jgi:hypothetical protein
LPPLVANIVILNPGEGFKAMWRALYSTTPEGQCISGILLTTTHRIFFLEERGGSPPALTLRDLVEYNQVGGISVSGFLSKQMAINAVVNNMPRVLYFTKVFDVDKATLQNTGKVSLPWLQGYLLERKNELARMR